MSFPPITFEQYLLLPPEMREYVLSFADSKTMYNYARCSKLCNEEAQHFNTRPPVSMKLDDIENGILVTLGYSKAVNTVPYKFPFLNDACGSSFFGLIRVNTKNCYEKAAEYLEKQFKYVRNGTMLKLEINLRRWPSEIMKIRKIQKCQDREILVVESMFDDFYDFIKNEDRKEMKLSIKKIKDSTYEIPRKFFETTYFKNLRKFHSSSPMPELVDEIFLDMKTAEYSVSSSPVTEEAINQKIVEWLTNASPIPMPTYSFHRTYEANTSFDVRRTLRGLPFVVSQEREETYLLRHSTGVKATLYVNPHEVQLAIEPKTKFLYERLTYSKDLRSVTKARALLAQNRRDFPSFP